MIFFQKYQVHRLMQDKLTVANDAVLSRGDLDHRNLHLFVTSGGVEHRDEVLVFDFYDLGANAAKFFTWVYNLNDVEKLFQRFPGVEGSIYVVAGVGVNYQKSGDMVLAPIRTGVGLRSGANVGYLHYNKEKSWIPF